MSRQHPSLSCFALVALVALVALAPSARAITITAPDPLTRHHPARQVTRVPQSPFGLAGPSSSAAVTSGGTVCGAWTEISPNVSPMWRDGHCTVYDSARDRLLILGGYEGQWNQTDVLWSVSLGGTPSLAEVPTSNFTTYGIGVYGATAIYDPVRDRILTFGGTWANGGWSGGDPCPGTVHELSLSGTPTWNDPEVVGTPPPDRGWSSAIYDATDDRMILFGGRLFCGGDANDVWALSLSGTPTWTQISPSGTPPPAREFHTAVYDAPRNRMLIYGGYDAAGNVLGDVYALSLSGSPSWTQVTPTGGAPVARGGQTAITDAPRNRMLIFGGWDNSTQLFDTWSLSYTNPIKWTQLSPTGVIPTSDDFRSIYDPVRQRMLSFSGDQFWNLGNLAGTPAWSMLVPTGQVPLGRMGAGVIYDSPRQRLVVFGGFTSPDQQPAHDLWTYSFTGSAWTRIAPTGAWPSARKDLTATYDPAGDRMVLFGGANDNGVLNETWQLSLSGLTWTHLTPTGTTPPARSVHTAILDAPRNRVVIYGGADLGSNSLSDVWALSLAGGTSWSQLNPTGGPAPARQLHVSVFDAPRNRMLTFGWNDNSVWALGLAGTPSWSQVTTSGTSPPALAGSVGTYDAARDRMLISTGETPGLGSNSTTYALDLSGTPTWSAMETSNTPSERFESNAMWDAGNDRMLMFGGNLFGTNVNDIQALSFPSSFALTVSASPTAGGSVQQSPSGTCQPANSQVTITAVPTGNYSFVGWSGDASGTTNPLVVTMNAAKNIVANFDNYALNVFISPVAGGTVTKNPELANYPPNSQVTLTANPAAGYGFANWSGDASGSINPLTVTMTSSKNITAIFVGYPVNVTISPSGSGTVTKNPNQVLYAPGTQVTLTASGSFTFLGWSGDASGNTNPLVITVDGPKNITAAFQAYTVTTIVSPAGAGSVSKTPSSNFYNLGSKVALGAAPVPGYQFSSWSGDLTGSTNPDTVLVNGSKTVTANFTLTAPVCGGWSMVPTASQPQARDGATAIWDPIRHRIVLSGGVMGYYVTNSDLWSLTLGGAPTWTLLQDMAGNTVDRYGFYDPVRDRMLLVAGVHFDCCTPSPSMETWAVSLTGPVTWTQITTVHTPPARNDPSVIYDPLRDRLILFGGGVVTGPGTFSRRNDVWQLNLAGTPDWTQITPAGTPPPVRMRAGAIYDPVRDRMVIMAGDGATPFGAWALSLSGTPTWTDLNPWGAPHQTTSIRPIYDAARDRAVIVWGDGTGVITTLDFKGNPNQPLWAKVYPLQSGGALGTRAKPAVVYDSDDDLILVAGGSTAQYTYTASSLRLDLSGGYFVDGGGTNGLVLPEKWCYGSGETANLMGAPNQGYQFSQWFGDATGTANPTSITVNTNEVVRAEFVANVTGTEETLPLAFGLGVHPNPAVGPAAIEYSLPREAAVRLRVFDISGREIERLVDGSAPAGRHVISWGRGGQLRAGIYLVRFETPAGSWTKRLALLR